MVVSGFPNWETVTSYKLWSSNRGDWWLRSRSKDIFIYLLQLNWWNISFKEMITGGNYKGRLWPESFRLTHSINTCSSIIVKICEIRIIYTQTHTHTRTPNNTSTWQDMIKLGVLTCVFHKQELRVDKHTTWHNILSWWANKLNMKPDLETMI